jgi:hypothetical protein
VGWDGLGWAPLRLNQGGWASKGQSGGENETERGRGGDRPERMWGDGTQRSKAIAQKKEKK